MNTILNFISMCLESYVNAVTPYAAIPALLMMIAFVYVITHVATKWNSFN